MTEVMRKPYNKPIPIMGHLVAGYPDREGFTAACRAMADGGIEILELQLPFSDPTADGPLNTEAGETALRNGFKMRDLPSYLDTVKAGGFDEIHIMTYANILYRQGMKAFVDNLDEAGVTGIIIPDLPLEDEEGFYAYTADKRIDAVPVVIVNMRPDRAELLKSLPVSRCYAALRQGVTGSRTIIEDKQLRFLDSLGNLLVYAGFGITNREQIEALRGHAHAAVVGSYFTSIIHEAARLSGSNNGSGSRADTIYRNVLAGARKLSLIM
jgi:tryptophan synthase alpha chain